jgi:hypothetical protein
MHSSYDFAVQLRKIGFFGEHLQRLPSAHRDFLQIAESGVHRDACGKRLSLIDGQDIFDEVMQVDLGRRACIALVSQRLPRDV